LQGTALDARQLSFSRPLAAAAAILFAAAAPAAGVPASFEGHWANPKHSMIVNVSRCGGDYCAVVIKASEKAQANARKGGTEHFIGTEILRVHPAGSGTFKGTAFDPESNMHVAATVRVLSPGAMDIKGCALLELVCEDQHWTKVS
jgi:uncharacterized protein (DUF2147 family)